MKKTKREKQPSARELFERMTRQLEELNRRYSILFEIATTPGVMAMYNTSEYTQPVTLERDMRAGETVFVRIPQQFKVSG